MKQTINIGTVPGDHTGDTLRSGGDKINDNFIELYDGVAFQTPVFANPLTLDGTNYKDFKAGLITGNTTVNLTNVSDGAAGMIELIIDGIGGYAVSMGAMFTKKLGSTSIVTTANADNFISWRKIGADIVYTVIQKV